MHSLQRLTSHHFARRVINQQRARIAAGGMSTTTTTTTSSTSNSWKATWTRIAPGPDRASGGTPMARSSHGVSVLMDGSRLIVYGGEHVARTPLDRTMACYALDNLNSVDDESKLAWRSIDCTDGPSDRIAHAQAVHDDKHLYVFGGRAGITMKEQAMNDLWMLDCSGEPGTETWSVITPDTVNGENPPEERSFHSMICVGSCLYMFGGCGASHGRLHDLWKFDTTRKTWHFMGNSSLRGRGGPSLFPICKGTKIAVVAGFAGEETKDGHIFDISTNTWDEHLLELDGMRPRSVCVSGSFPSLGVSIVVGGEVDPSDKGHEGAGGFENDVVILDESTVHYQGNLTSTDSNKNWPGQRGWADADVVDQGNGHGYLYLFGGLSGDDENPTRMDDLWKLDLEQI